MSKRLIFVLFTTLSLFTPGFNRIPRLAEVESEPVFQDGDPIAEIKLADLGFGEPILLNGPYQEISAAFALPPDWKVNGDLRVELQLQVAFQSLLEAFTSGDAAYQPVNQEGVMRIRINDAPAVEKVFEESGTQTLDFTFPAGALHENVTENRISISWDAAGACVNNITSYLAIGPESTIQIPHDTKSSEMALTDFPRPFYDAALLQSYPTAIILTNPENENDLSALMAISAGLGKHSVGKLSYEVFTADEARSRDLANDHLILIGQQSAVVEFLDGNAAGLTGAISAAGEKQGAGLIWYGLSPWNPGRTLMVVTGEDGLSVAKGAAVIAGDHLVPYSEENLAVISDLASSAQEEQLRIDYTLGDLLADETALEADRLGATSRIIQFNVPGDVQVTSEAYLELYFRHSQLLNYLRSGLSVSINGRRIGTVRFSDNTAENGLIRILLPPNIILPQKNELELTFTLTGQDLCADERSGDYWVTVFDQSYIHLPPELSQEASGADSTFNSIPAFLMRGKGMSDLTFAGAGENFDNWRYASRLAFILGSFTEEQILTPVAVTSQLLDSRAVQENLILIGLKDGLSAQAAVNRWLPLPINAGTPLDNLTINGTQFDVADGGDYGFLEIGLDSQSGKHVLLILGSSPGGLQSAFTDLQEIIASDSKPAVNVRIVDRQGHSFEYQVAQATAAYTTQTGLKKSWFERLTSLNVNDRAGLLLVVLGLATVAFLFWTIADARRKRRRIRK